MPRRAALHAPAQDKRGRFFLVTALKDTAVPFAKALAIRLGLKKGELRMAPPEAMPVYLGVASGAATPLAAAAPTARRVVLLLDERLRDAPFYIHPMTNARTVRVASAALNAFLEARGVRGYYADLSRTEFAIGPDNPPDLREAVAHVPEEKARGEMHAVPAGTDIKKERKAARCGRLPRPVASARACRQAGGA